MSGAVPRGMKQDRVNRTRTAPHVGSSLIRARRRGPGPSVRRGARNLQRGAKRACFKAARLDGPSRIWRPRSMWRVRGGFGAIGVRAGGNNRSWPDATDTCWRIAGAFYLQAEVALSGFLIAARMIPSVEASARPGELPVQFAS